MTDISIFVETGLVHTVQLLGISMFGVSQSKFSVIIKYFSSSKSSMNSNRASGKLRKWRTYRLKLKSNRSNTRTGPVLLRMVRGWPANRQKTAPVIAVPRKLSNTPCTHRGEQLGNNSEHSANC